MSRAVHQVLAGAAPRDAITTHALHARALIRGMGLRSEIFVDTSHLSRELIGVVEPHDAWHRTALSGDHALIHYSIDSPAFGYAMERAGASGLQYHNVTPPHMLWRDAPHIAFDCRNGLDGLARLVPLVATAAADSEFNAKEMVALGFADPAVIGILRNDPPAVAHQPHAGPARMLFLGRGAPNKGQYDLVLALAALRDAGCDVELRLVGSWGSNSAYLHRCLTLAAQCGVDDRLRVLGSVDDETLANELAAADVFVCLSEHEGYGVPIIEAMAAGLPIVAYAAGAVPETLGNAGLLLDTKQPSLVAEAVMTVLAGALRDRMVAARPVQLAEHSARATGARMQHFVRKLVQC